MNTIELLSRLRKLGIEVHANGEQLHINAPKGALSPDLKEELKERKNEILAFLKTVNIQDPIEMRSIPRYPRGDYSPLSYSQERIWFLDQLHPGNYLYNMPRAIRLKGVLNIVSFEQALNEIITRHEVLRTTFTIIEEQPVQIIHSPKPLQLAIVNLTDLPLDERLTEAKRLAEEEAKRPFDLRQDLLLRVTLLKLAEEDHVVLITFHHIASDGWSYNVFSREFITLYEAFSKGIPSSLPPLSIQYADFAQWQRDWLQGYKLETQLNYWREQLGGDLPQIELRHDKPRPSVQFGNSAKIDRELSVSLSQALRRLSQEQGVTLFMTLLSAFKLLLHRYTGLEDIIVGTPIAGRNHSELEELIGMFLNTLVLRTDLSGNPSFRELLQRVRRTTVDAYTYQDIPFEKLLVELQPERNLSRAPLFQVFFNMLNLEEPQAEIPQLTVDFLDVPDIGAKFDLTLYVREQAQEIQLSLVYNSDIFSQERMKEMVGQFEWLLQQVVRAPDKLIDVYSLVTPQAHQVLPDPTLPLDEPKQVLVHEMIKGWVKQTPGKPAIKQNEECWTYAELYDYASLLAHQLISKGLKPGDVVAVHGPRSFQLVASMIATFLSGGVLLSIDHTLPDQRKQLMLQEAAAKFLVCVETPPEDAAWIDKVPQKNIVFLDDFPANLSHVSALLIPELSSNAPAYIFFTSGTTGIPKAVLGNHKGLSHFLCWQRDTFGIQPQDRAAQLTALSFDVVLRDIFTVLISGGTLCIPPDNIYLDAKQTLQWLQHMHISLVHTVPALAQTWLSNVPANISLTDLRWIFFAGEPLKDTLIYQWRARFAHGHIVNFYGPTETTMAKCFYQVPENPLPGVQPIGSALPQTQALILNRNGELCGIGEPGEIVLRTPFRTFGYVNVPEENTKRFITNPFRNDEQDRLYYSGDKGCYRPDGKLDILGRIDGQIKIRGIRIELGEIESVLSRHSDIQQAVVSIWEAAADDKRLIAYIVPFPKHSLQLSELRPFLRQQLPDYMIPSIFIPLNVLPLTPNGKINRAALPLPDRNQPAVRHAQLEARDNIEEKLVKIWEDLLHIHSIGVQDSFFELGGHSLMAVHMFARINTEFNVNMPLATLFQEATIEHLAQVIRGQNGVATWSSLIEIEPRGSHPPFFCVHGLTGDILWFRDLAHCLAPDFPFYGLQSRGLDGIQSPLSRIEDMAAHYIQEIKLIQPTGPYYLGGASFGGAVALEIAQQLSATGEAVSLLAIFDHALPNVDVDSNQGKFKRRLVIAYRMMKNFPRWLNEFVKLGPSRMLLRLNRKLKFVKKAKKQTEINRMGQFDAGDLIDFAAELSAHRQELITCNYQALKMYVPRPYAGEVTLFRALNRPLLNTYDPEAGWQKLASGRVKIFDIPSSHEGMFKKPQVNDLADKLRSCLEGVQAIKNNRE